MSRTVNGQDTTPSIAIGAPAEPGEPACDRFLDRTDTDPTVMVATLRAMPLDARGDIVASMSLLAQPPNRSSASHRGKLKMVLEASMSTKLPSRPDVVEAITAIMAEPTNDLVPPDASKQYLAYLRAAKAKGTSFTEQQRARLMAVAERVAMSDSNLWGKTYERRNRQRAREFLALADALPGDLLDERLASQPSPNRLRPLPDNIDFWCAFLDRVANKGEALARELAAEALPDWAADLPVCARTILDYGLSDSGKAYALQPSAASVDILQLLYLEGSQFQLVAAGYRILCGRSQGERRKVFSGSGIPGDGMHLGKYCC